MKRLGRLLARLGGANLAVLDQGPKETGRYIAMGIVLLSTAFLAVLSMTFAMANGLHVRQPGALLVGLAWGGVIINLDRLLILSLRTRAGTWRTVAMIMPRILMAALLGVVIATPLTLRIFQPEIQTQLGLDNIDTAERGTGILDKGAQQAKLDKINGQITTYENALNGKIEFTAPDVEQAQKELTQAEADKKTKADAYSLAWANWRCELDGQFCNGGSGKSGPGPRATSLKMLVDTAQVDLTAASTLVEQKRTALTRAQTAAMGDNKTKLTDAQVEAKRVLPGLRSQRDDLQSAIASQREYLDGTASRNNGILAQLVALDHLGDNNSEARWAHLLVAGLFFTIELLPVAVKTMMISGPPTLYSQINELEEKRLLEDAIQNRSLVRRRRKRREDKAIELDEDMYDREVALGKKANERVADIMSKVIDGALDSWSKEVARLLVAQNQQNQGNQPGGGPASAAQTPTAGQQQAGGGVSPNGAAGGQQGRGGQRPNRAPRQRQGPHGPLNGVIGKLNLPPTRKQQP
ncbi:DUF4407 domain-containing protein [Frankia sp. Cj3]|uniref:DUF4407 domain-containing protein n=1 Tax=Frankia sp. Cj3 TaxID=2880976 RepID=UPI001EF66F36|nr:DUF4407 domain-containing protein [Frankia sp. Cj3]